MRHPISLTNSNSPLRYRSAIGLRQRNATSSRFVRARPGNGLVHCEPYGIAFLDWPRRSGAGFTGERPAFGVRRSTGRSQVGSDLFARPSKG